MWLDEVGEVVEMFRSSFPLSFLFFIPLLVMMSPITPADAAHDFAVYRMQQYDLQGAAHGMLCSCCQLVWTCFCLLFTFAFAPFCSVALSVK